MKHYFLPGILCLLLYSSCINSEKELSAYTIDKADTTDERMNPLVLLSAIKSDTIAAYLKDATYTKDPAVTKVLDKLINHPKIVEVYIPPVFSPGDTAFYKLMGYNSPKANTSVLKDVTDTTGLKIPLFDPLVDATFHDFAYATGGEAHNVNNAHEVAKKILEILTKHTKDGTDVYFLIDKTGSMGDDIQDIKKSLKDIIFLLKKFKGIRVGWGSYGDKNCDGDKWFVSGNFTDNLDIALDGIRSIRVYGGGDYPESVNDAIVKSVDELSWRPKANKMMLVIGDAPSLTPPLSTYSQQQVIARCKADSIDFNIYPIIIGMYNYYPAGLPYDTTTRKKKVEEERPVKFTTPGMKAAGRDEVVEKFFPNPVKEYCNIVFTDEGNYLVEVKSLYGDLVLSQTVSGSRYKIDFSGVAAGMYVIVVTDITQRKQRFVQIIKS